MFPSIIEELEERAITLREEIISTSSELAKTPYFDFTKKQIVLINGSPKLISDIEAIRQWIILFLTTPRGVYRIYDGTNFGVSVRKLFGRKTLNNGYEEAEVEREIREGLPLCPAISRVTSVNISKSGRIVIIKVEVELFSGELITETAEVSYTIK